MTTVIADTSPINYLVLIREIDILPGLFGEILLPPAVHEELQREGAPLDVKAWAGSLPPWAKVVAPKSIDPTIDLGRGENEAISLAKEIQADVLLIDERLGRLAARVRSVHTVGTVLLLGMAHERGLLDFDAAVSALQKTTFRVSPDVVAAVRAEVFNRDKSDKI